MRSHFEKVIVDLIVCGVSCYVLGWINLTAGIKLSSGMLDKDYSQNWFFISSLMQVFLMMELHDCKIYLPVTHNVRWYKKIANIYIYKNTNILSFFEEIKNK